MEVVQRPSSGRGTPTNRERDLLSLVLGLSQQLHHGATLEDLLEQIAAAICDLSGADSASVMLFDPERGELSCQASAGLPKAEAERIRFHLGEGIAGWVADHGEPVCVADTADDRRFKVVPGQQTALRSLCCVPMLARAGVIGVLTAGSPAAHQFDQNDQDLLCYLAAVISKDVENARLYRLAITDPLTGVYNRQYLYERLPSEVERHRRYEQPLSLVIVDIDLFKRINDTWGHAAGDAVLREVAVRLKAATRDADFVARYGGEEFLLVLPSTPIEGARQMADRLHEDVGRCRFGIPGGGNVALTISAGVAELASADADATALIARADARLYQAKAAGRDRVL